MKFSRKAKIRMFSWNGLVVGHVEMYTEHLINGELKLHPITSPLGAHPTVFSMMKMTKRHIKIRLRDAS